MAAARLVCPFSLLHPRRGARRARAGRRAHGGPALARAAPVPAPAAPRPPRAPDVLASCEPLPARHTAQGGPKASEQRRGARGLASRPRLCHLPLPRRACAPARRLSCRRCADEKPRRGPAAAAAAAPPPTPVCTASTHPPRRAWPPSAQAPPLFRVSRGPPPGPAPDLNRLLGRRPPPAWQPARCPGGPQRPRPARALAGGTLPCAAAPLCSNAATPRAHP
jgi:hypothetical protein